MVFQQHTITHHIQIFSFYHQESIKQIQESIKQKTQENAPDKASLLPSLLPPSVSTSLLSTYREDLVSIFTFCIFLKTLVLVIFLKKCDMSFVVVYNIPIEQFHFIKNSFATVNRIIRENKDGI